MELLGEDNGMRRRGDISSRPNRVITRRERRWGQAMQLSEHTDSTGIVKVASREDRRIFADLFCSILMGPSMYQNGACTRTISRS